VDKGPLNGCVCVDMLPSCLYVGAAAVCKVPSASGKAVFAKVGYVRWLLFL